MSRSLTAGLLLAFMFELGLAAVFIASHRDRPRPAAIPGFLLTGTRPARRLREPPTRPAPEPCFTGACSQRGAEHSGGPASHLAADPDDNVSLTYTNESAIPHDWHLFDGPNALVPSIASAKIQACPNDVEHVSFTVPSVGITSSPTCTQRS